MADVLRGPVYLKPEAKRLIPSTLVPNLLVSTLAVVSTPFFPKAQAQPPAVKRVNADTSTGSFPLRYLSSLPPFIAPQHASPQRPKRLFSETSSRGTVIDFAVPRAPFFSPPIPLVQPKRVFSETSRSSYPVLFPVVTPPFFGYVQPIVFRRAIYEGSDSPSRAILETPVFAPFKQTDFPNAIEFKFKYEPSQNNFASPGVIPTAVTVTIKAGSWIRYRKI